MDVIDIKSVVVVDEDVEPDKGATNRGCAPKSLLCAELSTTLLSRAARAGAPSRRTCASQVMHSSLRGGSRRAGSLCHKDKGLAHN